MPRRFPIVQFPNPPLIVAGLAGAAARLVNRRYSRVAQLVSYLGLLVWAVEEISNGANWLRRLFGLGGGAYAVSRLLESVGSRRRRASAR
jgi:hypothetical protein